MPIMGKVSMNVQIFLAIVFGGLVGLFFGDFAVLFGPVGDIFLNLLKMIVVPIVITSIVMGVVSLGDVKELGKMGGVTGLYFILTTLISTSIGVVVVTLLAPGRGHDLSLLGSSGEIHTTAPVSLTGLMVDIIPQNIVNAMSMGNILPIIFFSLVLGVALISIGQWVNTAQTPLILTAV